MKKIAIIGTQGLPAKYGGFETLVGNLIDNQESKKIQYTVFCSSKDLPENLPIYKNAHLRYTALHANGIQSIPYDIISLIKAIKGYDAILVLGVSGCLFLPLFRLFFHKKLIINIDGQEYKRAKWGKLAKWILKRSEAMAIKYADIIIADNKGIQDNVSEMYGVSSRIIAYGGDHVNVTVSHEDEKSILQKYGLNGNEYSICICRIEPENNCHLTLEAFSSCSKELVFVGNWTRSEYGRNLLAKYKNNGKIHFIESLYDLKELYVLRKNCEYYIHGHSAGGTNPSLVEAMFFKRPILAYDVIYNKETTFNRANYFKTAEELVKLLSSPSASYNDNAEWMLQIAQEQYRWSHIVKQYEELY